MKHTISAPYVRSSATSRAAARQIEPVRSHLQKETLETIRKYKRHGMTCDQVESFTGMPHQTASARIRELALSGHIIPAVDKCGCPVRRLTRSGRSAVVWVAVKHGRGRI